MRKTNISKVGLIVFSLFFLIIGLAACQTESEPPPEVIEIQEAQAEASIQRDSTSIPETQAPTVVGVKVENPEPDPAAIEAAWQSSPHADTFILDANGQNNTCARCHAPINWMPSMADLPESCYACKFELEDPPSTIAESDWNDIPCNICHKVDKKGNVEAEFAWLEIAPLGEYADVASPSELCLKCHTAADVPGHSTIQLGGDHPDYICTDCHSAHDTSTSCDAVGCHPDVIEPVTPIPGHDQDHRSVTCGACHDASGMEVGPDKESGLWTTFISGSAEDGVDRFPYTSHNVVLDARCDRCHFVNNPWGLSDTVKEP
jgi:hypothetical protein